MRRETKREKSKLYSVNSCKTVFLISVIILYYNKEYEIRLVLESFLRQTIPFSDFEIIIVDDGSNNSIESIIAEYISCGLSIKLITKTHTGNRAQNRDSGVKASKSSNIVFLDADMIPPKDFLEKHLYNLSKADNVVSLGIRRLLNPFSKELIISTIIQNHFNVIETMPCELDERFPMFYAHERKDINLCDAWYIAYSHNIALKKNYYFLVKGFDENFKFGWGAEDIDFALRLFRMGCTFVFDKSIVSYHIPHNTDNDNSVQYRNSLGYFYNKHKSFEVELFMLQHVFDAFSTINLYQSVYSGKHLSELKIDIGNIKNTLFVGFAGTADEIRKNGNTIVSTNDDLAEYRLIGYRLPYEDNSFEQVILSENYSCFQTELLYEIIKELIRVGKEVKVQNEGRIIDLDEFWKNKTGCEYNKFCKMKKIRILMTPGSENRQNNVLFVELVKALNQNGYYANFELTGDELKDSKKLFPACIDKNLEKYYIRNLSFLKESVTTIIDSNSAVRKVRNDDSIVWWGDIPYYNQNEDLFLQTKTICNTILIRNDKTETRSLQPGIRAEEINTYLKTLCDKDERNGILIVDLLLNNLDQIIELIEGIRKSESILKYEPITIVTLNPILDEFKIYKNFFLHLEKETEIKHKARLKQLQNNYLLRLNQFTQKFCTDENVFHITSMGTLDEFDNLLCEHCVFIDLNQNKNFNPYLLEAAAYGLRVYTASDIYENYNYSNINLSDSEILNAIYDYDFYFDMNRQLKNEVIGEKRKIKIKDLLLQLEKDFHKKSDIKKIIKINEKNSWKKILTAFEL